jgi:acyl carrier protein
MIADEQIRAAVAEAFKVAPAQLQPDTVLSSLPDFDSVVMLMLLLSLEELGLVLPLEQMAQLRTFGDILALPRQGQPAA